MMAYYLLQVAYTPEAAGALLKTPQDRREAVRPAVEQLGGKIESFWFALGEHDAVVILQMPDHVAAAALAMAISASGALKSVRTTPLLTVEEGTEAMRKAGTASYRPPGR